MCANPFVNSHSRYVSHIVLFFISSWVLSLRNIVFILQSALTSTTVENSEHSTPGAYLERVLGVLLLPEPGLGPGSEPDMLKFCPIKRTEKLSALHRDADTRLPVSHNRDCVMA